MEEKILIAIIIVSLLICVSVAAQIGSNNVQVPENMQQAGDFAQNVVNQGKKDLPGIIKNLWENSVLPIWKSMYNWADSYFLQKAKQLISNEIQFRKPIVKEEFQKSTEQMGQDITTTTNSEWERFKELFQ